MEDLTLRYYDAEMRYLRDAAKEFAQAHPDRAAMLSLDNVGAADPYVERLFEGFAFSMGRLQEKIDDDIPELTEGLISLLWPHYLRTIPSLAIVAFTPELAAMKITEHIPAGLEVYSQPVGPKNSICRYRTTQDVVLHPLQLSQVMMSLESDGRSTLSIRFDCSRQTDWSQVDLRRVVMYLAAESSVSSQLHLMLTRHVAAAYLRLPGQAERMQFNGYFSAGGFDEHEGLWPRDGSAFSGYQLLLEYFTFREKFMFVHLHGLEGVQLPAGTAYFDIEIVFHQPWPSALPVPADAICLHCVPVINLFALEADPLTLTGLQSEYLLRPKRLQDGYTEIYSVDAVMGSKEAKNTEYVPFSRFQHFGDVPHRRTEPRFFHTRVRQGVTGLHDMWLILGGGQREGESGASRETLSLRMTGTNGQLPLHALQNTLLERCEQKIRIPITVKNLCQPSMPVYPPVGDRFHWRILSHLGSGFLNMMSNAEVLRGTLALYNWQESELNHRRLSAIQHITYHRIQRFEEGFLLRGLDIEVTLDRNGFTSEGDLHLFGELLNRFFAQYADMNQFNQLTLIVQPEGKSIRWKENHCLRLPSC